MQDDLKVTGWWTAYAFLLMAVSGGWYIYRPEPKPPTLSVKAEPSDLDSKGIVRLTVHSNERVRNTIEVPFLLEGMDDAEGKKGAEGKLYAKPGQDFDLTDSTGRDAEFRGKAVIRAGERASAPISVSKLSISAPPGTTPLLKSAMAVVKLLPVEGYTLDPPDGMLELPVEITDLGPPPEPYKVEIVTTLDPPVLDHTGVMITLDFILDREVRGKSVLELPVQFKDNDPRDFSIEAPGGASVPFLRFAPGQRKAPLILKRLPTATRGEGNREFIVTFRPGDRFKTGRNTAQRITILDPKAVVSWDIEPKKVLDRRAPDPVQVRASMSVPRAEPVTIRYRVVREQTKGKALAFKDDSGAAPDDVHVLTIPPGSRESTAHTIQIAPDDLVGGPPRRLSLEPEEVLPRDAGDAGSLGTREIVVADDKPLPGRTLVLVVLNQEMARNPEKIRPSLEKIGEQYQNQNELVGKSLYLLAGDRSIYRLKPTPEALKQHQPFAGRRDANYEAILSAAKRGVETQIGARAQKLDLAVLVWMDPTTDPVDRAAAFEGFDKRIWHLLWIGPRDSRLATALQNEFYTDSKGIRFHQVLPGEFKDTYFRKLLDVIKR